MSAETISSRVFFGAMLVASDRVCSAREELCALDAAAGDGDLGATLATGFAAVRDVVADGADDEDCGAMLVQVGGVLARRAPSTIGALLASAFIRSGKELAGVSALGADQVALMLRAATTAVAERGRSETGERTVLDAMDAAGAAAERAAAEGAGAADALTQAAAAARKGAEATAEMEPRHGRAGWIGERARGRPDAGAIAWAVYLEGLSDGVQEARQLVERSS